MMRLSLSSIILIAVFICNFSNAQKIEIQGYILTENTLLNKEINKYIAKRKSEYQRFKKYGYIEVYLEYFNAEAKGKELFKVYKIKDQYLSFTENSKIPLFFTEIKNKLVLLFFQYSDDLSLQNLSKKSLKRLQNKINKNLEEKERLTAYDKDGNKVIDAKEFYPNESINIHGGILLKIFADNSIQVTKNK